MSGRSEKLDQLLITGGGLLPEAEGPPEDWSGRTLGSFELVEIIGSGGMATVYRARRVDQQFEQQVAVKVLGAQFSGEGHQQRFLRERQILADLDHPAIARIIDGGVEDSRPYLVMDLVNGLALDGYVSEHQLAAEPRLELFAQIARAVAHAHSKGVAHLDLKPGNVLVTDDGQPRLLDFGIAAVQGAGGDDAGRLFTPRFAAPEQFEGGQTSTATDVYQLGLLLHFLITGRHALAGDETSLAGIREAVMAGELRPLQPAMALPAGWRGDLASILRRCLATDPAARYPTATHLVEDLQALLDRQPLRSRLDQPGYRLGKYLGRHRLGLGLATIGAVVVVAVGMTLWQQVQEQRERAAASARDSAALGEVVNDLLESVDPLSSNNLQISEVISSSSFELSSATRGQPAIQRELVLRSGRALLDLGRYEEVIALVEPLVMELKDLKSPPPRYAEYLSLLGYARYRSGELQQGLDELNQALAFQHDRIATPPESLAQTLQRLALAQRRAAQPAEALANMERALGLLTADTLSSRMQRAQALSQRGLILTDMGQYEAAVASYADALAAYDSLEGDHSLRRAMTLSNLADTQRLQGELDAARGNAEQSIELLKPIEADNPRLLATARITLGNVEIAAGQHAAAASAYRAALATYQTELGPRHPRIALVSHNLATALRLDGNCAEALQFYDQAIDIASATYPENHPELAESRRQRALCVDAAANAGQA